jgi:hypothetical protein
MKKCLIFFTLLLLTIAIAVIMQHQENLSPVNDIVIGGPPADDLIAEKQLVALD